MIALRRRSGVRAARRADAGTSLAEVLVSLGVTSIVLACLATVTLSTLRANGHLSGVLDDATQAQRTSEVLSRTLRVATVPTGEPSALVEATDTRISFYALMQRDGALGIPLPTLVTYSWDAAAGCLRQTLTPARALAAPTASGSIYAWDAGAGSSCLARTRTAPSATAPWFRYYPSSDATTAFDASGSGGLSAADRQSVRSVAVAVPVTGSQTLRGTADTRVTAEVRVVLANVSLASGGQA